MLTDYSKSFEGNSAVNLIHKVVVKDPNTTLVWRYTTTLCFTINRNSRFSKSLVFWQQYFMRHRSDAFVVGYLSSFYFKLTAQSTAARTLQVGQQVAKLWAKIQRKIVFWTWQHSNIKHKLVLITKTKLSSHKLWAYTHIHTRLTALCPGLPGWAGTRKVKPI